MQEVLFILVIYLGIILLLVKPLGWYIAQVYSGKPCFLDPILSPIESFIYRICGVDKEEMNWKEYALALLYLNLFGVLFTYAIQRLQIYLPFNPQGMPAVEPYLAFNTAVSFVTNTNWQAYSGEEVMSYCTQNLAFTVQNFISAATSLAILVALIRGIVREETTEIGNFWVDIVRSILYILLPLSFLLAIALISQGVIQNYKPYQQIDLLEPVHYILDGTQQVATTQTIPMGPVASQVAIKQLGSNGGGFFGTNSAHPFENPNQLSNLLEMLAILLIPAALCYSYGLLVKNKKQGWMILLSMLLIFIPCTYVTITAENIGNPALSVLGMEHMGNMEGKESRIGVANSALWATATTATSNGSVNSMHDSYMPLSGIVYLLLMHLGEIVFGGVGCGLFGMLMMILLAVFIAGLMVGRSPEYMGKKIEPFEMKMVAVVVLVLPLLVLIFSAIACATPAGVSSIGNPGSQGFSEILYAFTSMRNNNGSAFAGLNSNTEFYNIYGALVMFLNRYWQAIAVLAVAGSLARKKIIPATAGTLATHSLTFLVFLIGVIGIIGALSFFPTLALGPIVEHLMLWSSYEY